MAVSARVRLLSPLVGLVVLAAVGCSHDVSPQRETTSPTPTASASGRIVSPDATTLTFVVDALGNLDVAPSGELRWDAVDGAVRYAVVAAAGQTYPWIWFGTATSVRLGEADETADEPPWAPPAPSPSPLSGPVEYRWFVTAFDGVGHVLATSRIARLRCDGVQCSVIGDR